MAIWKKLPGDWLNEKFASNDGINGFEYPNLDDGSTVVLASDYSGEHALPEFRVLAFLLTTYKSLYEWEPRRLSVRQEHLADGRRISFKAMGDALRINAFSSFIEAASQLNGVLICIGVEKGFSFPKDNLPARQHDWAPDSLNKLVEICLFGSVMINGLRMAGQPLQWITDDDSIVSNDKSQEDALALIAGFIHRHGDELPDMSMGIASKFDDGLRAEDLVAIPDLAAGAFSGLLTVAGKESIAKLAVGRNDLGVLMQTKSSLINGWRSLNTKPLKHINAIVRGAETGQMHLSFGTTFGRLLGPNKSREGAPVLNSKWRRALEAHLKTHGIDPKALMKEMEIDTD
jgi:hypothetical protein